MIHFCLILSHYFFFNVNVTDVNITSVRKRNGDLSRTITNEPETFKR